MQWDKQNITKLVLPILSQHTRDTYTEALADISKAMGRDVTGSALRHALRRHGFKAPGEYLETSPAPVTSGVNRIIVCPDTHFPYQDELAWNTFLRAVDGVRPDVLVIIGDFADFFAVSRFPKKPNQRSDMKWEIEQTNGGLNQLQDLGIKRVVYCEGNHEYRLESYLVNRAPELFGLVSVRELLKIDSRGWEWVAYKDWIRIGKVAFTHDIERCGVNAARQSLVDFGGNLVFGHTHRGAVVYQGTVDGAQHVCMNVGWLGDFDKIDYRHKAMARRDWQHGFGYIEQEPSGNSWCQFVPIVNGRCRVGGRSYAG